VRAFAARFSGPCAADCGEPIRAGDEITIRPDDGQWQHATCADNPPTPHREPDPCPSCWTVHAGECL
jgi:hypothetical protein